MIEGALIFIGLFMTFILMASPIIGACIDDYKQYKQSGE